ncbi:MAG: ATP-binding protein [Planctomycetota bacterium]
MPAWLLEHRLDAALYLVVSLLTVFGIRRLVGSLPASPRLRLCYHLSVLGVLLAAVPLAELAGQLERDRLQALVAGMAPTYAHEMERLGIADVDLQTPPDDPTYLRLIRAQIDWLRLNPAIADVYTFVQRDDGQVALLVDSETDYDRDGRFDHDREARTAIGEVYDEVNPALERAFAGAASFCADPVTDRWGTWVSAFEPLRRADGSQCGVLGVDYPAEAWVASILRARGAVLAMAFLLVLVLAAGRSVFMLALGRARAATEAVARQRFLAHMSHEIRTPMTAILGHADLLGDSAADEHERREGVEIIRRSGRHLLGVLDDILDLAKIESGHVTAAPRPAALGELLDDVAAMHSQNARQKGLRLEVRAAPGTPAAVWTDARLLRQVLLNLVGNAVKFTDRGAVTLSARRSESERGPRLELAVTDTGPGIAAADQHRLFEPFVQGDAGLDRAHGGTGLGLSISRRIAAALEGTLTLRSAPGQGSTFVVDLPCHEAPVPSPTEAAPQRSPLPSPPAVADRAPAAAPDTSSAARDEPAAPRVLVVDDGADNRLLLRTMLVRHGFVVDTVDDGQSCLERLLGGAPAPDLVLMDVQMPRLDGQETTRRLRAAGFDRPILAVTAYAMAEDRELCLQAGYDDHVAKPIDREHLLQTIERLLRRAPPLT